MDYYSSCKSKCGIDYSHLFCISLCKVIIYSDYMHWKSGKSIKVCTQSCNKSLTFSSLHFSNVSFVHCKSSNKLYVKRNHIPSHLSVFKIELFSIDKSTSYPMYGQSFQFDLIDLFLYLFVINLSFLVESLEHRHEFLCFCLDFCDAIKLFFKS